ncbi:Uncharacterised protein [Vibrio cholerae]|nr:Uncharacterised protein [Vibrio cholerae]
MPAQNRFWHSSALHQKRSRNALSLPDEINRFLLVQSPLAPLLTALSHAAHWLLVLPP